MPLETLSRPVEVQNKTPETGDSRHTVEYYKKYYEDIRQKDGDRLLAYVMGGEYQEAKMHNRRRWFQRPYSPQQDAIESLLPQIKKSSELKEVFDTSYQLSAEFQKLAGKYFNISTMLNESPKDSDTKGDELDKLSKIISSYHEQILTASKPTNSSEQLPPLPRLCIEATKYQIDDKAVPEKHTHSCPICSAKK